MAYINPSVNPCENFYEFACGGFKNMSILRPDQSPLNSFSEPIARLRRKFYEILSNDTNGMSVVEPRPYSLAKTLFRACNSAAVIKNRGLDPLRTLVNRFGGWPVVIGDQWNETEWTWQTMLIGYSQSGAPWNHLFKVEYDDTMIHYDYNTEVRNYIVLCN